MVLNPDKCHFMTLDFQDQNLVIRKSAEEKILGMIIDNKLNFKSHHKHLDSCKSKVKCPLQNFKLYGLR